MYHVLIVDDERIIREGLARHVAWNALGAQVTGTAGSAKEALSIIASRPVDLLVTDIKMPVKNGLDMVREIMESGYAPQVILISSYNDFTYAQQAVSLDLVCDYVLKPIDVPEFERKVRLAIQKLQKRRSLCEPLDTHDYMRLLSQLENIGFDRHRFVELLATQAPIAFSKWAEVEEALQGGGYAQATVLHFFSNLLLHIEELVRSGSLEINSSLSGLSQAHTQLLHAGDKAGAFACMRQALQYICETVQKNGSCEKSPLIAAAVEQVRQNYRSVDFNLSSLAAFLNVTPNYLSMRFKEEIGIAFTRYLTRQRLEHAKILLRSPQNRISAVANAVGFSDEKYFIRVFKQEIGETPKKFQQTFFQQRGSRQ